jgi:hypothetical protein
MARLEGDDDDDDGDDSVRRSVDCWRVLRLAEIFARSSKLFRAVSRVREHTGGNRPSFATASSARKCNAGTCRAPNTHPHVSCAKKK